MDADGRAVQKIQDGGVALQVRAGGIAVGIAGTLVTLAEELAQVGGVAVVDVQFTADLGVEAFGVGLGQLRGQAVEVKVITVGILAVEVRREVRGLLAQGDHLQGEDVQSAAALGQEEIRDAQAASGGLSGEGQALENPPLCGRSGSLDIRRVNQQLLTPGTHGEVAVAGFGAKDVLCHEPRLPARQDRFGLLLQGGLEGFVAEFALGEAPTVPQHHELIQEIEEFRQGMLHLFCAPERRDRELRIVAHPGALARLSERHGFASSSEDCDASGLLGRGLRGLDEFLDTALRDGADLVQAFEGIRRVKHRTVVDGATILLHVFSGQRSATENDRNVVPQLLHQDEIFPHHHGGFHQ